MLSHYSLPCIFIRGRESSKDAAMQIKDISQDAEASKLSFD